MQKAKTLFIQRLGLEHNFLPDSIYYKILQNINLKGQIITAYFAYIKLLR